MPQNTNIALTAGTWGLLTNSDVTALRVQNLNGYEIKIAATVGAVAPTNAAGAITLLPYAAIAADLTLAQLFPGVSGANRVYAFSDAPALVSVSHV